MLHEQIKNSLKDAMLAKDAVKLKAVRNMLSAFTNELVAKGKKPNEFLSDEEALAVIARLAKQRKDSIEQFRAGQREDLVKEEGGRARHPRSLPAEDDGEGPKWVGIAEAKKAALGITDAAHKGLLMSALMKDLKGKADGATVKEAVDGLF
ncbi:MAG: GatB/YqeY domain-containing protein [bacterium]